MRVNAIAPGYFSTEINADELAGDVGKAMLTRIPTRRFGDYEELSGALLLLASDAGSYMTGSTIPALIKRGFRGLLGLVRHNGT